MLDIDSDLISKEMSLRTKSKTKLPIAPKDIVETYSDYFEYYADRRLLTQLIQTLIKLQYISPKTNIKSVLAHFSRQKKRKLGKTKQQKPKTHTPVVDNDSIDQIDQNNI